MKDIMEIEIQEDGKIKVTTEEISDARHLDADELLEELEKLLGGERITTPNEHPFFKNKKVLRGGKIVKAI